MQCIVCIHNRERWDQTETLKFKKDSLEPISLYDWWSNLTAAWFNIALRCIMTAAQSLQRDSINISITNGGRTQPVLSK